MSSSPAEENRPLAKMVLSTDEQLVVELVDGRRISVPLSWYPRLESGSARERSNWRLIGAGSGIHWPDLDEDISIDGLIGGRRSGESDESLRRWIATRPRTG